MQNNNRINQPSQIFKREKLYTTLNSYLNKNR
jgi:hypothetical protein